MLNVALDNKEALIVVNSLRKQKSMLLECKKDGTLTTEYCNNVIGTIDSVVNKILPTLVSQFN